MWLAQVSPPENWLQTGVIATLVLSIIWTGLRRKWVFGWIYDEAVARLQARNDESLDLLTTQLAAKTKEADEWKRMALIQGGLLQQTVERTSDIVRRVVVDQDDRVRDEGG